MLQKKKLEYYARQYGIGNLSDVVLTDGDCERICGAVGIPVYPAKDFGGNIATLIAVVMDNEGFIARHRSDNGVPEDLFLMRCGDYAAREVFAAYTQKK